MNQKFKVGHAAIDILSINQNFQGVARAGIEPATQGFSEIVLSVS